MNKLKQSANWVLLMLVVTLALAPNGVITRYLTMGWDPIFMNLVRYLIVAVLFLPWVIKDLKLVKKRPLNIMIGSFAMALAVISFVLALSIQEAGMVGLVTLTSPLFLILFSSFLGGESISSRAKLGIIIAAVGALMMFAAPMVLDGNYLKFHPAAVALTLADCIAYPLAVVYYGKANKNDKIPMVTIVGFASVVSVIVSYVLWAVNGSHVAFSLDGWNIPALIYASLLVSALLRTIYIKGFEKVGAGVTGSFYYLQAVLSVLLPIVIEGDRLSPLTLACGAIVLFGVWMTKYHKLPHFKHHQYQSSH